ncbi:MAG: tRNA 2-selenouridine(34) synthase MnmH [Congregibacter sp.]
MKKRRADTLDYAGLFLAGAPLLDTRAPLEFQRGAFPGAVNLPLMSDEERAAVGTCYKRQGQDAAIALGHKKVSGEVRAARVAGWADFAEANPHGYLYCFRGGLRSQIAQQWLLETGIAYPRIGGGYKAMRRFLIESLEERSKQAQFWLVAGATGSGKTRLIKSLPRSIDLEGLARHRGSAFGRLLEPQPTQIDFENALSIALLKLAQKPGPIALEDEGRLIGSLSLPATLLERMVNAPLLQLEYSLDERVQVVLEDYIIDLGRRYREQHEDPEEAMIAHRERLVADLARTRKRLGRERHQQVDARMQAAFDAQSRSGDIDGHRDWIGSLLADYYDPMYRYQLSQRKGKSLCIGSREAIADYMREQRIGHAG